MKRKKKKQRKESLPKKDASAERLFHNFLAAWNKHIREQINIHKDILKGKESLKHHIARTERIHKKFLKQLKKI